MAMTVTPNAIITASLAPAVAISGAALMTTGLLNRLAHLGSRVRQLNKEGREAAGTHRLASILQQSHMVLSRAHMVRNALVMLYIAIGFMVLTAFGLALQALTNFESAWLIPIWTFLAGLTAILGAVFQEIFEVLLALKALKLDITAHGEEVFK